MYIVSKWFWGILTTVQTGFSFFIGSTNNYAVCTLYGALNLVRRINMYA